MKFTETLSVATAIEAAKEQKWQRVEQMALQLLQATPDDPEVHNLLGAAYVSTGRPARGIESIKQAHRRSSSIAFRRRTQAGVSLAFATAVAIGVAVVGVQIARVLLG